MNTYPVRDAGDLVPAGLPRFAIYSENAVGRRLVALAIDEATARRIATLLALDDDLVDDQVDDLAGLQ